MGDEVRAKHTPGPWALGQPGSEQFEGVLVHDGKRITWAPDGMEVALVRDRGGETSANACLIAAAPELLDALREIIGDKPDKWGYKAASTALNDACRARARAAIDKAEGVAE